MDDNICKSEAASGQGKLTAGCVNDVIWHNKNLEMRKRRIDKATIMSIMKYTGEIRPETVGTKRITSYLK